MTIIGTETYAKEPRSLLTRSAIGLLTSIGYGTIWAFAVALSLRYRK